MAASIIIPLEAISPKRLNSVSTISRRYTGERAPTKRLLNSTTPPAELWTEIIDFWGIVTSRVA
jgi:hypothetical protein